MDKLQRKYLENCIFNGKLSIEKIYKANKYVKKRLPIRLYKYARFDEYSVKNFLADEVYFKSPNEFNDIFDSKCFYNPDPDSYIEDIVDFLYKNLEDFPYKNNDENKRHNFNSRAELDDFLEDFIGYKNDEKKKLKINELLDSYINKCISMNKNSTHATIGKYRNNFKISCFSENLNSMLMWSHYSESHKGFSIEYDFKNIDHVCGKEILIYPVFYKNHPYDCSKEIRWNKGVEFMKGNFIPLKSALVKSKDWAYEKEWRVILITDGTPASRAAKLAKPKSLYLGSMVDESNKLTKKVIEYANQNGIGIYKMESQEDSFSMKAVPFLKNY